MKNHPVIKRHFSKSGSAFVLVLLVFAVLMVLSTIGLLMVDFSIHASTRQANLKQAQLTARSVSSALAQHIIANPSSLSGFGSSETTPVQSIEGLGDFSVTLTKSGEDNVVITAVSHYPAQGTTDDKYVASATSSVQLTREQGDGNPFCSAVYVGELLDISNGNTVFDGTIIMLEDFGKVVTGGDTTLVQKIIVGGDFQLDTSVNLPGIELFVDGDLIFDTGEDNDMPVGVWVNGSVHVGSKAYAISPSGFVIGDFLDIPPIPPKPYDRFDNPDLGQWLIGGILQDCFTAANPDVKVGTAAKADNDPVSGWDAQYDYMQTELGKLIGETDDRALPLDLAQFDPPRSQKLTDYFASIGGLSETSRVYDAGTNTSTFTSDSGNGYANYGTVDSLNNAAENIVIDNGDTNFFLKVSFEGIAVQLGQTHSTTYTGNITNNGDGKVFLYADIPDTGMTVTGEIGSLYVDPGMPDEALLPMTRLFFISDHAPSVDSSNNKFWDKASFQVGAGGKITGFVFLPVGSYVADGGSSILGSVSAQYIRFDDNASINEEDLFPELDGTANDILPNERYYIVESDNSDWLNGTPFEVGAMLGAYIWQILVWS